MSVGAAWEALWTPLGTVVYRTVDGWTEVETDGTPARNYVLEGSDPVSFSPRGDVVARFRDSAWRFFDQDGGELGLSEQRIGDTFGPLQWSPDGRFVALQQAPPRTHLLDLDMGAITTLPGIHVLAWSPDGRLLAAQQLTSDARVRVSEFVVITLEGELVSEPIEVFRLFLFGVRWSPDSQAVTFQTERFGG